MLRKKEDAGVLWNKAMLWMKVSQSLASVGMEKKRSVDHEEGTDGDGGGKDRRRFGRETA